jgi:hypothetical protein
MATPFYTLGQDYNSFTGGTQYFTPFVENFVSPQVPRGEFERWLGTQNVGGPAGGGGQLNGFNRQAQFYRSLYGQTQNGYQAALLNNPALSYRNYLQDYFGNGQAADLWNALTPQQRGENPAQFSPRVRVMGRG